MNFKIRPNFLDSLADSNICLWRSMPLSIQSDSPEDFENEANDLSLCERPIKIEVNPSHFFGAVSDLSFELDFNGVNSKAVAEQGSVLFSKIFWKLTNQSEANIKQIRVIWNYENDFRQQTVDCQSKQTTIGPLKPK